MEVIHAMPRGIELNFHDLAVCDTCLLILVYQPSRHIVYKIYRYLPTWDYYSSALLIWPDELVTNMTCTHISRWHKHYHNHSRYYIIDRYSTLLCIIRTHKIRELSHKIGKLQRCMNKFVYLQHEICSDRQHTQLIRICIRSNNHWGVHTCFVENASNSTPPSGGWYCMLPRKTILRVETWIHIQKRK